MYSVYSTVQYSTVQYSVAACEEAQGLCARLLVLCSLVLVLATLPLSLCFVIKVVQVSRSQEPGARGRPSPADACRSTREQSYSAWGCCCQGERGGRACSSSSRECRRYL